MNTDKTSTIINLSFNFHSLQVSATIKVFLKDIFVAKKSALGVQDNALVVCTFIPHCKGHPVEMYPEP